MPIRHSESDLDRYERVFQELMAEQRSRFGLEKAYPVNPDISKSTTPYTPPVSYRYPLGYQPVGATPRTHGPCPFQSEPSTSNQQLKTNITIDPETGEVIESIRL